jgi:hypothetical protein
MLGIGLALVALALASGLAFALRRRSSRPASLASRVEPLPAGVKHLASTVSDLSDFQFHLPSATRAQARRRRLGVRLGLR